MVIAKQLIRQVDRNRRVPVGHLAFTSVNAENLGCLIAHRLTQVIEYEEIKLGERLPAEKKLVGMFQRGCFSVRKHIQLTREFYVTVIRESILSA